MPDDIPDRPLANWRRVPMILSCAAFAAGIAGNEFLKPSLAFWSGSFCLVLLIYVFFQKYSSNSHVTSVVLVLCFLSAGGLRHCLEFSQLPANEISRFVNEEPQPARMLARLLETPQFQQPRESFFQVPWK
jgi:hypothetical protein